jgi:hypothetical protein
VTVRRPSLSGSLTLIEFDDERLAFLDADADFLSGNGTLPGSRFTTSAGLMPRLKRNIAMSPTTLLLGVTLTMSPKSWFTSA